MSFFELCVDHSVVINWSCGFVDCAIDESPDVCCYPISFVLYQPSKYGIRLCQMLGLFKYGMATLYKASENVCIIADRLDFHIPKIFSMSGQSLHGRDR